MDSACETDMDAYERIRKELEDTRKRHESVCFARKSVQGDILELRMKPGSWLDRRELTIKYEQKIVDHDNESSALSNKVNDLKRQLLNVKDKLAPPGQKLDDLREKEKMLENELEHIKKQILDFYNDTN